MLSDQRPGRVVDAGGGFLVQLERKYDGWCEDRAKNRYKSWMGEIFRKVVTVTPAKAMMLAGIERGPKQGS